MNRPPSTRRLLWLVPFAALALACGGSTFAGGDASTEGGGSSDGGQDAIADDGGPDTSGPYQCGASSCGSGEVCVHPCCGGAQPGCEPGEGIDGGFACPPGTSLSQTCPAQMPCKADPCQPPPPYCAPPGQCGMLQGRDCYLVCA